MAKVRYYRYHSPPANGKNKIKIVDPVSTASYKKIAFWYYIKYGVVNYHGVEFVVENELGRYTLFSHGFSHG